MELTFEPASEKDTNCIFALSKALIDRYEDPACIDYDKVLSWVRRKIETNIGSYVRILFHGQHAGFYRLIPHEDHSELDDLYVFPQYQNQGIGTQVIKMCCGNTFPVELYVFIKNTGAVALYERMGFRIIQTVNSTRYIMRKDR